jgi:hypothetical protein
MQHLERNPSGTIGQKYRKQSCNRREKDGNGQTIGTIWVLRVVTLRAWKHCSPSAVDREGGLIFAPAKPML